MDEWVDGWVGKMVDRHRIRKVMNLNIGMRISISHDTGNGHGLLSFRKK